MNLEAAGISAFLVDSATSGMLAHLSAVSNTRLQVHEDDAEQALEILQSEPATVDAEDTDAMLSSPKEDEPATDASVRLTECPSCGAQRIEESRSLFRALFGLAYGLFSISSMTYAGPLKKDWRCLRCGHRWRAP